MVALSILKKISDRTEMGLVIPGGLCAQVRIVFRREVTSLWRSSAAFHMPVLCLAINSVIFGSVFFQLPFTADTART